MGLNYQKIEEYLENREMDTLLKWRFVAMYLSHFLLLEPVSVWGGTV